MDISQPLIVFDTARFTQENRGRKGGGLFLIFFFSFKFQIILKFIHTAWRGIVVVVDIWMELFV